MNIAMKLEYVYCCDHRISIMFYVTECNILEQEFSKFLCPAENFSHQSSVTESR